jgi:hypothetical protein
MGNCDPYSDSPEPMDVDKPQSTRVEGASIVMKSCPGCDARNLLEQLAWLSSGFRRRLTFAPSCAVG